MRIRTGDAAPKFEVRDSNGDLQTPTGNGSRHTLLCFFRHAGCPYCNLRVSQLINAAPDLARHNIRVVTVFQSGRENIERDVGQQQPPFPIIPDPDHKLYKLYGVTPSWLKFLRAFFLRPLRAPYAIFIKGFSPKYAEGDPHMAPAEFLIAPDGAVRLAYYGKDISDHVALADVYAAVDQSNHATPNPVPGAIQAAE